MHRRPEKILIRLAGIFVIVATLLTWLPLISPVFGQESSVSYIVKNVSIVDLQNNTTLKNQDVIIEGDQISNIVSTDENKSYQAVTVIDGSGKFMMPGLIDSHVHLREPDIGLKVYPGFGITTVRVMEGSDKILKLKKQVSQNELFAPTLFTTTPYIEDLINPETDIDSLITTLKRTGYDFVKIHDDIPEAYYRELVEATRKAGIKLVGHAQRDQPIAFTVESLQDEISHSEEFIYTYFDDQVSDTSGVAELVEMVASSGITVVPNIIFFKGMYRQATDDYFQMITDPDLIYVSPQRRHDWIHDSHRFYIDEDELPWHRDAVRLLETLTLKFHQAGVPILAGTDTPLEFMIPGKSLLQELYNFVGLGLSPDQALKTATVNAAEFMGEEKLGSVKQGYQADLLLLDENPLEDIRNIEKLKGIFLRGRWYPKNDIEEKLKRVSDTYHKQEIELNARQATTDLFIDALDTGNVDSVISVFKQIDEDVPTSLFGESELNSLGYQLLSQDKTAEAIKIFKLNTKLYPESANVWDSLGEAYWKKGEIEKAIESYENALRINPQFENAKRALKELREI